VTSITFCFGFLYLDSFNFIPPDQQSWEPLIFAYFTLIAEIEYPLHVVLDKRSISVKKNLGPFSQYVS
jgi:hypothetical protein